jgi:phosphatidylethanolamine/phosphatidyl-N-methylethanolamine N-methyltransferase
MKSPHESQLYHGLSCFYDVLFGPFLIPGIHSTIRGLKIPRGSRVLELGVGTGLSLPAYPDHAQVIAIDSSEQMLHRANHVVRRQRWKHITLRRMNALQLEFADDSFDYVMAFHILTVVNDCNRLLDEITRVAKYGATIVIINHLRTETRWSAKLLELINPVTRRLGWRTTLSYKNVIDDSPLCVVQRYKTSARSPFTVIIAKQVVGAPPVIAPTFNNFATRSPSGIS